MDTGQARRLFDLFRGALAYIEVEGPDGGLGIGSSFHVGDGVFVTARHVVEGKIIREVRMTETFDVEPTPEESATVRSFTINGSIHNVNNGAIRVVAGPFFHEDSRVDVATFRAGPIDSRTPVVPLGTHLDDYLGPSSFVLTEAIILGFPPIPMTVFPVLVGARAEVNALAPLYDAPHLHLILSATARGGFSGGVAISEDNYALGLVTRSLVANDGPIESGYMAVLGVEPIYECLAQNKLLPAIQSDSWDGYWNTDTLAFTGPGTSPFMIDGIPFPQIVQYTCLISVFDDGKRSYMKIDCDDSQHREAAENAAKESLASRFVNSSTHNQRTCKIDVATLGQSTDDAARKAAQVASAVMLNLGYRPIKKTEEGYRLLPSADSSTTD
jgi:hypothetical protein